jgi:hypothetical protein
MKVILKSVPEKLCMQEISWKLGADISLLWKFVLKYEDFIDYFYIL